MENLIDTLLKVGIKDDYLILLDKSGKALPCQTKLTLMNELDGSSIRGISTCKVELLVDTREIKVIDKIKV